MRTNCSRPDCLGVGFTERACVQCGMKMSVGGLLSRAMDLFLEQENEQITPAIRRRARRFYFIFSVLLCVWTYGLMEKANQVHWLALALLSIVYIGVSLVTAFIVFGKFLDHLKNSPKHVRVAFILNYLSALFALQWVMGTWWDRSLRIGILCLASWAGAFFFLTFLFPALMGLFEVFATKKAQPPSLDSQGRNIRNDS